MPVGHVFVVVLGNGLLVVSVVIIRTNLLTQSPEWMGGGWDLIGLWL